MRKTALIAGASGLVGNYVLKMLIEDDDYDMIISIGRRELGIDHVQLHEEVVNFDKLDKHRSSFVVDHVFCCLGTTMKKAKTRKKFRKIDLEYPLAMARLAAEENVRSFNIITAMGADPNSMVFYNKVKGELQEHLKELSIPSINVLQPSLLTGPRNEERTGEQVGKWLMDKLDFALRGPLKKYRSIEGKQVAKAMVVLAKEARTGYHEFTSDVLQSF